MRNNRIKIGFFVAIALGVSLCIFNLAWHRHTQPHPIGFNPIIEHSEIPPVDTDEVYQQIHKLADRHQNTLINGMRCQMNSILYLVQGHKKLFKKLDDSVTNYWMPLDKAQRDSAKELELEIGIGKQGVSSTVLRGD